MRLGTRSALALAVGAIALGATAGILAALCQRQQPALQLPARNERDGPPVVESEKTTATSLSRAAALLAVSALADIATEHFRGSFHNPVMLLPLMVGAQAVAVNLQGVFEYTPATNTIRAAGQMLTVTTGVIGLAFHFYNVTKRPGGWSWYNLFYAAPLGAPAALCLVGLLGGIGERLRHDQQEIIGMESSPLVTGLVAVGLLGTSAEAALLHFRGAYQNPAMFIPVTLPPIAAGLLAAAYRSQQWMRPARLSMRVLIGVGLLGAAFHAYGVQRAMGGWRNWSQNLLNGPPLPAPPAFTALAIAGLGALDLAEQRA
ncbi:MAG: hypothetical protein JO001_07125 [Alphaproteobacteria bacterium]|nr:hypothetical protein [Alphaproteobacteria bacterium]